METAELMIACGSLQESTKTLEANAKKAADRNLPELATAMITGAMVVGSLADALGRVIAHREENDG